MWCARPSVREAYTAATVTPPHPFRGDIRYSSVADWCSNTPVTLLGMAHSRGEYYAHTCGGTTNMIILNAAAVMDSGPKAKEEKEGASMLYIIFLVYSALVQVSELNWLSNITKDTPAVHVFRD